MICKKVGIMIKMGIILIRKQENILYGIKIIVLQLKPFRLILKAGSNASCCNKHWFEVDLRRDRVVSDTHNYANFYAPINSTKTVDLGGGFFTSDEYYIELTNHDALPSGIYLVGEGEVYCS